MKTKTITKAILVDPRGKVLLLKRSLSDARRPGDWDFPGGEVDSGEDLTAGVLREIEEEVGLQLERMELKPIFAGTEFYEAENTSNTRVMFLCHVSDEQTKLIQLSAEHSEYHWLPVEQVLQDFRHWFWSQGLSYALEHDLL